MVVFEADNMTVKNGEIIKGKQRWLVVGDKPNQITLNVGEKTYNDVKKLLEKTKEETPVTNLNKPI